MVNWILVFSILVFLEATELSSPKTEMFSVINKKSRKMRIQHKRDFFQVPQQRISSLVWDFKSSHQKLWIDCKFHRDGPLDHIAAVSLCSRPAFLNPNHYATCILCIFFPRPTTEELQILVLIFRLFVIPLWLTFNKKNLKVIFL